LRVIFILALIFNPGFSNSPNSIIDSLEAQLNMGTEQEKLVVLQKLIAEQKINNPEKVASYLKQAISIAQSGDNYKDISKLLYELGTACLQNQQIDTAQKAFSFSLANLKKIHKVELEKPSQFEYDKLKGEILKKLIQVYDLSGRYADSIFSTRELIDLQKELYEDKNALITSTRLGYYYFITGDHQKSLQHSLQVLKQAERVQNDSVIAQSLNYIGFVHRDRKNYEKALEYFSLSVEKAKEANNNELLVGSLNEIGNIYSFKNDYSTAMKFKNEALGIAKEIGYERGISFVSHDIGNMQNMNKEYEKALMNFYQCYQLDKKNKNIRGEAIALFNIGDTYFEMKDFEMADKYLLEAKQLAEKAKLENLLIEIYYTLSQVNWNYNNYKNAYTILEKSFFLKDTIYNNENSKLISEMQAKYDTERKEKELRIKSLELSKQEMLRNSLIVISVMILLIAITLYNRYRFRLKAHQQIASQNQQLTDANIQLKNEIELRSKTQQELETTIIDLQKAEEEVKVLGGLLPICANCKKIRDDEGDWQQIESYIHEHSEADFSHSICPDCFKELYPELDALKRKKS